MKLLPIIPLILLASVVYAQTEFIRCGGKILRVDEATAEEVFQACGEPTERSPFKLYGEKIIGKMADGGIRDSYVYVTVKQWWTYPRRHQKMILRFEGASSKTVLLKDIKRLEDGNRELYKYLILTTVEYK